MDKFDIFLSVGATSTPAQETFVRAVEDRLRSEGLTPRTVGRNTFGSDAPLKTVTDLMDTCTGAVVVALERTYFPEGVDRRGGPKERKLADVRLPTPWNHIEAAMAYSRKLPLLVIVENNLKSEGLLEPSYDWYVQRIDPTPQSLNGDEFNGVLSNWKMKLAKRPALSAAPAELTIGQIVANLKPAQLYGALVALSGAIGGAFLLGGKMFGH